MNIKTKFRESFRPFAPSVLQERVGDYFEVRPDQPSPTRSSPGRRFSWTVRRIVATVT